MTFRTALIALGVSTCLVISPALSAQESTPQPAQHDLRAAVGENTAVAPPMRLSLDDLDNARGRATVVLNDQDIDGVVSDNTLGDYAAGAIALSDNALSNFNGIGNFLFNTGAQNNLQAGMTVTIVVED